MLAWVAMSLVMLQAGGAKTVWDGVYSAGQAERGKASFLTNCSRCHMDTAAVPDPRLRGVEFMERWREGNLDVLFEQIRLTMPPNPRGNVPRYPDDVYLDILTYILQANNFPAGSEELNQGVLNTIRVVGKDGPKPVPNFALVQVVGCLMPRNETDWMLTGGTEPVRTTKSEELSDAEIKAAESAMPGNQTFRLNDLYGAVSGFMPASHRGQKVAAKGVLVRQNDLAVRINTTWLQTIASTCPEPSGK